MRTVTVGSHAPIVVKAFELANGVAAAGTACEVTITDPTGTPDTPPVMSLISDGYYMGYYQFRKGGVYRLNAKVTVGGIGFIGTALVRAVLPKHAQIIKQEQGVQVIKVPGETVTFTMRAKDANVAPTFTTGVLTIKSPKDMVVSQTNMALADGKFTGTWTVPSPVQYGTYTAYMDVSNVDGTKTARRIIAFEVRSSQAS